MLASMKPEAAHVNERILAQVEGHGGSYVWGAEIFAVTVMGVEMAIPPATTAGSSGATNRQTSSVESPIAIRRELGF